MKHCVRCNHDWKPDKDNPEPKQCPRCKSYFYNKPREWHKVKEKPESTSSINIEPEQKETKEVADPVPEKIIKPETKISFD